LALLGGNKNEKPALSPLTRQEDYVSTRPGEVHTLLGRGSEFEGKLTFEGQVRIDGKFGGQIFTKDTIIIGDGARVTAEISAGTVVVHGMVEGNIKATHAIELHKPGRVKGNLEAPSVSMDPGVAFDGNCKTGAGAGTGAAAPEPAAAAAGGRK
jgi:cytoskeletal protein CcmA (bactofilin family)